jgi:saccharopine dehydrogenase-like NADP-dependent oxidoreductase
MHRVLLLGAGKIGRMIAKLLSQAGDYDVVVGDMSEQALERLHRQSGVATHVIDARNQAGLREYMQGCDTVISALDFRSNPPVAAAAVEAGLNYFDLTEDVETTRRVREIAVSYRPGRVVMPQCGLAPGFISIVASRLTRAFDAIDTVHMRVGALPQFPSNALKYNLTWSTDGLINEYCNLCEVIYDGSRIDVLPLEGLETFSMNGVRYEAFNTSGGLGTLCETLNGRVRELNYKTIRYPGHRDLVMFLVNDLMLSRRRDVLKDILEQAIPVTFQDLVVTFCTVTGRRNNQLVQVSDARTIYSQLIDGEAWSAIQITTAAGVCAALDLVVTGTLPHDGFVRQEEIDYDDFLENRFGRHYRDDSGSRFGSLTIRDFRTSDGA